MNTHDLCAWNMMINQKQLTVLFHTDDLMMAHFHSIVVTEHIKSLDEVCGSQDPLTVSRGKIHKYLSVTIDFSLKVCVAFHQHDFIRRCGITCQWN